MSLQQALKSAALRTLTRSFLATSPRGALHKYSPLPINLPRFDLTLKESSRASLWGEGLGVRGRVTQRSGPSPPIWADKNLMLNRLVFTSPSGRGREERAGEGA